MTYQTYLVRLTRLFHEKDFNSLETEARQMTMRYPDAAFAWKSLGTALMMLSKPCIEVLQVAVDLQPCDAEAHLTLGNALRKSGLFERAIHCYRVAVELNPDNSSAHCNMGIALRENGKYGEALDHFHKAIALKPDNAAALYNLGNALRGLGEHDQAVECYRRALDLDPELTPAHSNLLFTLNFGLAVDAEEMYAEACRFGARAAGKATPNFTWANRTDPDKCLNIGLVSGDFGNHPVGYFLSGVLPLLAVSARNSLKLYAYSNNKNEDELTVRLKSCCFEWRVVSALSDHSLAETIRNDEIDILIDLSGHTARNRLCMFSWNPAPVQVSWLGYFATTGVSEIKYLIADPWLINNHEECWFTERIRYLPETRLCCVPPDYDIEVTPLPALKNGYVTFACFNNLSKINNEVVTVWAKILLSMPTSRLYLKSAQFKDAWVRRTAVDRFVALGVDSGRIILEGHDSREAYLAAYQKVDITLDPFPYPGGTTTVESLWMGVPVLTLSGSSMLARQGVSLLMNAGLPDWIAADPDEYVSLAISFANKLRELNTLRTGLRQKVLSSPIFNAPRFASGFEKLLREIWHEWCDEKKSNMISAPEHGKTFVQVGCSSRRKENTAWGFNTDEWLELRLDISETARANFAGTVHGMRVLSDASVDAVVAIHFIEHLYPHEVPTALSEFKRVLKPDGFVVISCPDLQSVCALVAEDKLTENAYTSPEGSIAPLDILYGSRSSLSAGDLYLAHHTGFTRKILTGALHAAGFTMVAARRSTSPNFDLWALATVQPMAESDLQVLVRAHFPPIYPQI